MHAKIVIAALQRIAAAPVDIQTGTPGDQETVTFLQLVVFSFQKRFPLSIVPYPLFR
jgi:hypothetical protein